MNCSEISTRLIHLRKEKGLTQKEIAEKLGIERTAYAKVEIGERRLSSEYCIALADLFGVTCDYILRGVSAENVDFASKTGLTEESIRTLAEMHTEECSDMKSYFVNMIINNHALWEEFRSFGINVIEAYEIQDEIRRERAINVSQYIMSLAFGKFIDELAKHIWFFGMK